MKTVVGTKNGEFIVPPEYWGQGLGNNNGPYLLSMDRCTVKYHTDDPQKVGCHLNTNQRDCEDSGQCLWKQPCSFDIEGCFDPNHIPANVCYDAYYKATGEHATVSLIHQPRDKCGRGFFWMDEGVELRCHPHQNMTGATPPI